MEGARLLWEANNTFDHNSVPFSVDWAYRQTQDYQDIADGGAAHDPIFDCKRSIYSTWQMMKRIGCLNSKNRMPAGLDVLMQQ